MKQKNAILIGAHIEVQIVEARPKNGPHVAHVDFLTVHIRSAHFTLHMSHHQVT